MRSGLDKAIDFGSAVEVPEVRRKTMERTATVTDLQRQLAKLERKYGRHELERAIATLIAARQWARAQREARKEKPRCRC